MCGNERTNECIQSSNRVCKWLYRSKHTRAMKRRKILLRFVCVCVLPVVIITVQYGVKVLTAYYNRYSALYFVSSLKFRIGSRHCVCVAIDDNGRQSAHFDFNDFHSSRSLTCISFGHWRRRGIGSEKRGREKRRAKKKIVATTNLTDIKLENSENEMENIVWLALLLVSNSSPAFFVLAMDDINFVMMNAEHSSCCWTKR